MMRKLWILLLTLCVVVIGGCVTSLARAEALIAFDVLKAGDKSFESLAINVDDSVMFSPLSGGMFYREAGAYLVLPIYGSCQQAQSTYFCTVETGDYSFRFTMDKVTKKGKIWPLSPNFDAMGAREAAVIDLGPRLLTK